MSTAIVIVAILALMVAAGIVRSATVALLSLVRSLLSEVFVNLGRLFVLGACLTFLVVVLLH